MTIFEVPLAATPTLFPITLGGIRLYLRLAWRNAGGAGWVLDLFDGNQAALVLGLPLVTGADLLAQHRHLALPAGGLFVATDADPDAVPTYADLGSGSHLYYAE